MPIKSPQIQAQSYRYSAVVMIGLLVALAAAVFYQTIKQDSFLSSVSAYYYTPAQAVFVGALIGLGACMIALQGTERRRGHAPQPWRHLRDRGGDRPHEPRRRLPDAVHACGLTNQAATKLDCPTTLALQEATRANVENNVAALLIVGGLALILSAYILVRDRKSGKDRGARMGARRVPRGPRRVAARADRPRGLGRLAGGPRPLHRRRRPAPRPSSRWPRRTLAAARRSRPSRAPWRRRASTTTRGPPLPCWRAPPS